MPVNMVVRRTAFDGFVAPAAYFVIGTLSIWIELFFKGRQLVAFFFSTPANRIAGLVLLAAICWGAVKLGKMLLRAWRHREIPVIDMDDEWMTYRSDKDYEQSRVFYKDIFRVHLRKRGEDSNMLVIELASSGFFRPVPDPIEIDLDNTNAQPEDVCDAIAERVVRQNPAHGQGAPLDSF